MDMVLNHSISFIRVFMSNQPCELCKNIIVILCDFFITPHFSLKSHLACNKCFVTKKFPTHIQGHENFKFFRKLIVIAFFELVVLPNLQILFLNIPVYIRTEIMVIQGMSRRKFCKESNCFCILGIDMQIAQHKTQISYCTYILI